MRHRAPTSTSSVPRVRETTSTPSRRLTKMSYVAPMSATSTTVPATAGPTSSDAPSRSGDTVTLSGATLHHTVVPTGISVTGTRTSASPTPIALEDRTVP